MDKYFWWPLTHRTSIATRVLFPSTSAALTHDDEYGVEDPPCYPLGTTESLWDDAYNNPRLVDPADAWDLGPWPSLREEEDFG